MLWFGCICIGVLGCYGNGESLEFYVLFCYWFEGEILGNDGFWMILNG